MILLDIFKTVIEILNEISNKYIIFIEVFVIRLFNIKDKHKLKILKYTVNK